MKSIHAGFKDDVADFLSRCDIVGGRSGIVINLDDRGRAAGDAYVELETKDDMESAIRMHKRELGSRYIEVFEANRLDVANAKRKQEKAAGASSDFDRRGRDRSRGSSMGYIVNLRGLPFKTTEREVADWLKEVADPIDVIILMEKGRPSGNAEAVFKTDKEARRVAEIMHRRDLGHRFGF